MQETSTTLTIDSTPLEIFSRRRPGKEPTIVFLHGWACSSISFHHFWNRPEFLNHSAIAIDLPGFGRSTKPENFSYHMEELANAVASLLSSLSISDIHLVAHSMSGAVALLLSKDVLSNLRSFTCIEGNLIAADCGIASRRVAEASFDEFRDQVFPELREIFLGFGEGYADIDAASLHSLYRSAASLVKHSDSGELLSTFTSLRCPKVYFHGDKNSAHPTIEAIGDIPRKSISNSDHFPMNDNPDEFYSCLFEFLSRISKGQAP